MNKRNGIIITFVLLLLLGTGSFVFANPSNSKDEEMKKNQQQVIEQNKTDSKDQMNHDSGITNDLLLDENDDLNAGRVEPPITGNLVGSSTVTTPIVVPGGGNHFGNNSGVENPILPVIPESPDISKPSVTIDEIKEKLEELDKTMDSSKLDEIRDLISTLPDSDELDEIKKELEVIQQEINIISLFYQLEDMVKKSNNRSDILAAKDFEQEHKISNGINSFREGDFKRQILNRLVLLMKILSDEKSPTILGITNGEVKKELSNISIQDDNEFRVFLDDNLIDLDELKQELSHGTHNIKVIDSAFNETQISFDIDHIAPVIEGLLNGAYYNGSHLVKIYVTDDHAFNYRLEKDGKIISYQLNDVLKEDGIYQFYAYDEVGNKTDTYTFVIDTVLPTASVFYSTESLTKDDVVATLGGASEEITILNNNGSSEYVFTENGEFEFEIQDKAGNVNRIKASVDYIDKEAPKYEQLGILNFSHFNTQEDVRIALPGDEILVFVTFGERLFTLPEAMINGVTYTMDFNNDYSTDDKYVYVAKYQVLDTDLGNVSVTISNYADAVLNTGEVLKNEHINSLEYPNVEVLEKPGFVFVDGGSFNSNEIVITNPDYHHMEVYKGTSKTPITVTDTTYKVTSNTRYTFVLYDKDGNEIERAIMIYDGIKPKIVASGVLGDVTSSLEEGVIYDKVSLTITDNDIHYIKRIFEDGSEQILREFGQFDSGRRSCTLEFNEGGNYKIIAIDRAGNEKSVNFSISEKDLILSPVLSFTDFG